MAASITHILVITILVSLSGINGQHINVDDVQDIINLLKNITNESPTMSEMASILQDFMEDQNVFFNQSVDNQSCMEDLVDQMVNTQTQMLNALTQSVDTQNRMEDNLGRIANTQTQMVYTQTQMAYALTQSVDTQNRMEATLNQIANTQTQMVYTQTQMANTLTQVVNIMQMQSEQLQNMSSTMTYMVGQLDTQNQFISHLHSGIPRDCSDLASRGPHPSGTYTIRPWDELGNMRVYCDMDTDGNGWAVFQHRFNGLVDFYRGWDDYENGFGSPDGEHWLGLRQIYRLTRHGSWTLRIDLEDFQGNTAYAVYQSFSAGDAQSYYRLSIGAYSGTAGDSLTEYGHNQAFTTKDNDNDGLTQNCAVDRQGAWWYRNCNYSNLNGLYLGPSQDTTTGMTWYHWKDNREVLKTSVMKIQRIN